ncbi:cytochrome P450 3A5 [Nemania sp. NC0429]|nr:cytochrome P450 3A5 [Nemania sp. NC0429]
MDLAISLVLTTLELNLPKVNLGVGTSRGSLHLSKFLGLLLLQYSLLKFYRVYLYPRFVSPLRSLPGPQGGNVLLGQELNKFRADSPIALQLAWSRRWPDAPFIRYLSVAGREALIVNSLAAHKAVLQARAYDFVKTPFFSRLAGEITGTGLLFAEGEDHRRQRRLLAGPFSVPNMRKILPVFRKKAESLSRDFAELLGDRPFASVEVVDALSKSTMDTIGVTILGIELGTISPSTTHASMGFQELYGRVLHQGPLGQLISVVNAFVPIRGFVPLEANRKFIDANKSLRGMLREIIEKRRADLRDGTFGKETGGESRDLLTYMLEEADLQRRQTGKEPWTVEEIIGHLLNFTSAGHESTANTIAWALYVLSTRHEIQDLLRAEIVAFLKSDPTPTYEEITGLPYLNNFVREVLRLYSPSIMSPRQASRDLTIEGVYIPKGTQIDLHMPLLHHNQGVWGPDASVFSPERWDALAGGSASPYAFEAFIQGPRMCPGKNFALVEIKAVLVELVSRWRFVGVERWDGAVGKEQGGGGGERARDLLVRGEEAVGRGVKLANPSLTYRPAGGLVVRFAKL